MIRRIATAVAAVVLIGFALSLAAPRADAATTDRPTTAAAYAAMFAKVSKGAEWGGGDVSLSAPLADGRIVWLYGDTFSKRNGMVHSSGIVQTGSTLRVANRGAQVLPNDGKRAIYWIEAATETRPGILAVTAAPIRVGTANGWDFARSDARSRVATVKVTPTGDLVFKGWKGYTTAPAPFADFANPEPGHVTYEHRAHTWADLADGTTLMTHANNYDLAGEWKMKGKRIDYAAYAPTFYAGDGIERHAA